MTLRLAPSIYWVIVILWVCNITVSSSESSQLPSTSGRGQPFTAIWNAPSERCLSKFGVDLHLSEYSIVNKSVIFYNYAIGLYPFIKDGVVSNGGIPQLVDLTSHLEKATEDILERIPDIDYDGIAVIDWEHWQPVWDANFAKSRQIYQTMSINLVRSRHPDWNDTLVEKVAILEFEQSARALFLSTLLLARQLRPNALWGFYHYPYCFYQRNPSGLCLEIADRPADQMQYLYDNTPALYPSIYIKDIPQRTQDTEGFVKAVINEAYRVRNNSKTPSSHEILSYVRFKYVDTALFLSLEHLRDTVLLSAEMGVSGIVIWVANRDTLSLELCHEVQRYIQSILGPLVKITVEAASSCSLNLCSGHGRCVGKILSCKQTASSFVNKGKGVGAPSLSAVSQNSLLSLLYRSNVPPARFEGWSESSQTCSCQCYEGWSGENCNIPS